MDDPIKVIWKYKNNNRRIQYHTYIFVGSFTKNIDDVLKKIKNMNLYDAIIKLTKDEHKRISDRYGSTWYTKFYNKYHLHFTVEQIRESRTLKKELVTKMGQKWYDTNIEIYAKNEKKLIYTYAALIKDENTRKMMKKKKRELSSASDDLEDIDFKMIKQMSLKDYLKKDRKHNRSKKYDTYDIYPVVYKNNTEQYGGDGDDDNRDTDTEANDNEIDDIIDEGVSIEEGLPDEDEVLSEIENIYKGLDDDIDENSKNTSSLIQQAFKNDREFNKKKNTIYPFDVDKDTNVYDQTLKDVYVKHYIRNTFIYRDDTIKTIKEKICYSIQNNPKFGTVINMMPSRQYMWCEYIYKGKVEKLMLGHKCLRRNELLDIDIEPSNNMRHYENLSGSLKILRDNFRKYGTNKIRTELEDENFILYDYNDYLDNSELYMIDIYNDLGKGYKVDNVAFKNLQDVYVKLYYPRIRADDLRSIIGYLNTDSRSENNKIIKLSDTINNDLLIENEIMDVVECVKMKDKYKHIFKENYVTHSVIYLNLRIKSGKKIDLFRIFNEFEANSKYPFVQYHTTEEGVIKFFEKDINGLTKNKEKIEILYKWFENTPFGINFKVKHGKDDKIKYTGIGLSDTGRIEYKITWKEKEMAAVEKIKDTYEYVRDLIKTINGYNNKIEFFMPDDMEFKYAFINTIQKFELPNKHHINHNNISDFSRFFYPYVALVIDPRKRQGKIKKSLDTSKFGTYLRYKRVSRYENKARLEQRIIYFIRNYEHTDPLLATEISKQFNITEERALREIERVKLRYPNLKKSRKILKKLESIPKYRLPGIGIDIQGKNRENYKIKIAGARDKYQLDRIIDFMNILVFLYIETYLFKKKNRQILKDKLRKLTNIAKRRNKVDTVKIHDKDIKSVKEMAKYDKARLGFKPEKGQNQWTRACQNSGTDKKRQPQQYKDETIMQLVKKGYSYNKKKDTYERKVKVTDRKGNRVDVVLNTIKLPRYDDEGNATGEDVYYACDPEDNGDQIYVGFLTRSSNPHGQCMPCCFIINQATSKNDTKREFFNKCLGKVVDKKENPKENTMGDMLYILQDTNKIQEGRIGFLPKYLDFYLNEMLGKNKKIKHHYLVKTDGGYCFKLGVKHGEYKFLNAVAPLFKLTIQEIKSRMIKILKDDSNDHIFTALNSGDIKTRFVTSEKFIDYIENSNYLDFTLVSNLICIPKVLHKSGLNIIVFRKQNIIIKKTLEKEKIREDFYIDCGNLENINELNNVNRKTVILIKENDNYYPIIMVNKNNEASKNIKLCNYFDYEDNNKNIVSHINEFYLKNCQGTSMESIISDNKKFTAKSVRNHLVKLDTKYHPKYQVIDVMNKCKYIITNGCALIPTHPSGSLFDVRILKNYRKYIKNMDSTVDYLMDIYLKTNKQLQIKPIGVYYDTVKGEKIRVNSIMTMSKDIVPIEPLFISKDKLKKKGLLFRKRPLTDDIDMEIAKGANNYKYDDRIDAIKNNSYKKEAYELFRLEFSEYITRDSNQHHRRKIERVVQDKKNTYDEKVEKIKSIIYKIVDPNLHKIHASIKQTHSQTGGKPEKLVHVAKIIPSVTNYTVKNDRNTCTIHKNKDNCNSNKHCHWTSTGCYFSAEIQMISEFVNRISEELADNSLKAFEIFKKDDYYVSDIVDYSNFTEREGQKIFKSDSSNIKKILTTIFGSDNIPKIGKNRGDNMIEKDTQELNIDNPPLEFDNMFVQKIIPGNLSLLRCYVNCYYWNKYKLKDSITRNLGYYNTVQSDISNYFRGLIVDWLIDTKNKKVIDADLVKFMDVPSSSKNPTKRFIINLSKKMNRSSNGIIELYVLNKLNKKPIVVSNTNNETLYIFDDGIFYNKYSGMNASIADNYLKKHVKSKDINTIIFIRFDNLSGNRVPETIEAILMK